MPLSVEHNTEMTRFATVLIVVALLGAGPARAETDRARALEVVQALNTDLLSHDSATETLHRWCESHAMAAPPVIVAHRVKDQDKPAGPEVRSLLGVGPEAPVRYRHVELACGPHVLSEADNWYLPGRLTAEMNMRLDTSDEPFGAVVRSLNFHRRTLDAKVLFKAEPESWTLDSAGHPGPTPGVPARVLRHRAVLETPDGHPFSLVVETYTREVLDFQDPTP